MRYSFLRALLFLVLAAGCNYQAQIQQARAEADLHKAESLKLKADLDASLAQGETTQSEFQLLKQWVNPIPEGGIFPRPMLEKVPEFSEEFVCKQLGYMRCDFFGWRGGILEGYVQCQTGDEPLKLHFDVRKRANEVFRPKVEGKEVPLDPRAVSGKIMIGLKAPNKLGILECVVDVQIRVHHPPGPDGLNTLDAATITLSGAVDPAKAHIISPLQLGESALEASFLSPLPSSYRVFFLRGADLPSEKQFKFYELSIAK